MFSWERPLDTPAAPMRVRNSADVNRQADAGDILKQQVLDQRKTKAEEKQRQLEQDRLDDARIERERAVMAAEREGEIQKQRDREELVARREKMAALRMGIDPAAGATKPKEAPPSRHTDSYDGAAGGRVPQRTEYTGISEHSSTRVHAAPGGQSSFSLAHEERPQPPKVALAPRPLPRTEHMGILETPSTRVHAAPGGHSSFSLAHDAEPVRLSEAGSIRAPPPFATSADSAAGGRVAVRNEHTGIGETRSTRVHAAPGGKSSIVLC